MKTEIFDTPAGKILRLGDVSYPNRAWKRAEKKAGCTFQGFYNGVGAEAGSEAAKRHWMRHAARREPPRPSERQRAIQSAAAKALKRKLESAGLDCRGLSASDAFRHYQDRLPRGAGELHRLACGFMPDLMPARPLPLP